MTSRPPARNSEGMNALHTIAAVRDRLPTADLRVIFDQLLVGALVGELFRWAPKFAAGAIGEALDTAQAEIAREIRTHRRPT